MPRSWTDQDVQKIARMMRDGKSATEVGNAFQVNRNVIIGKVLRTPALKATGWKYREMRKAQNARAASVALTIPSIAIAPNRTKNVRGGHPAKAVNNPVGVGVKNIRAVPKGQPFVTAARVDAPEPLNVPLEQIGRGCKWPVNNPPRKGIFLFCGLERGIGHKAYCPCHHAQAYQPRQSMKVAA